jgi:hypothetical protein
MLARNSALPLDTVINAYIKGITMIIDNKIRVLPINDKIIL